MESWRSSFGGGVVPAKFVLKSNKELKRNLLGYWNSGFGGGFAPAKFPFKIQVRHIIKQILNHGISVFQVAWPGIIYIYHKKKLLDSKGQLWKSGVLVLDVTFWCV